MLYPYNNLVTQEHRRQLRNNSTDAERRLWFYLQNKQIDNTRWRRQYSVDQYILDFFSPELRLAIELDGGQHGESAQAAHDQIRTQFLSSQDIVVLRFWNNDVLKNIEGVVERIREVIIDRQSNATSTQSPPTLGGEADRQHRHVSLP